jgi:hypothetical protein
MRNAMRTLVCALIAICLQPAVSTDSSHPVAVIYLTKSYSDPRGIDGARKLSSLWKTLLADGGLSVDLYVPSSDRIVIGFQKSEDMSSVQYFLLADPSVVDQYVFMLLVTPAIPSVVIEGRKYDSKKHRHRDL